MTEDEIDTLAYAIKHNAYRYANEADLQELLLQVFTSADYDVRREVRLSEADRIDFVVERLGIEVKVNGTAINAARQVQRYLGSDQIDAVMLVTTRASHGVVPQLVDGRVEVVRIGQIA